MFASFVVPVFGTEAYLPRCLDSIFAQTDSDYEVIVVDDCSPGSCREIVGRYGSRCRYLRQDRNRGLMQARLMGLAAAQGDYVVSVDSDDYIRPGVVSELRRAASDCPDVIAYNIDMDFGNRTEPHWCSHAEGGISADEAMRRILDKTMQWNLCGKAIRCETWLRAADKMRIRGDLRLNVSEDFFACLPILMESDTVRLVAYAGYVYCQNAGSMCNAAPALPKLVRSIRQTICAMYGIMSYVVRERKGLRRLLVTLRIGSRIVRWTFWEYRQAKKKELFG